MEVFSQVRCETLVFYLDVSRCIQRIDLHVRSNSRHKEHVIAYDDRIHDIEDSSAQENDDPRLEFLQKFIGGLDPLNRALMVLYLEERSYCEIAEIIGISESNVASKISRLKKRVRQESSETNSQENQHGTQ